LANPGRHAAILLLAPAPAPAMRATLLFLHLNFVVFKILLLTMKYRIILVPYVILNMEHLDILILIQFKAKRFLAFRCQNFFGLLMMKMNTLLPE
jgi:hypothetical protein